MLLRSLKLFLFRLKLPIYLLAVEISPQLCEGWPHEGFESCDRCIWAGGMLLVTAELCCLSNQAY